MWGLPDTVASMSCICGIKIRFWYRVQKQEGDGCWLWTGQLTKGGYGITANGKTVSAHRVSYEMHYGPIPKGMCVLHKCDVRHCVRPDHLRLGTHRENIHDMIAKGRQRWVCLKGEDSGRAKLTETAVLDIRTRRMSLKAFGRLYGVHANTVRAAQRGDSWKCLDVPGRIPAAVKWSKEKG